MSRAQVKTDIYNDLRNSATLLALLGPVTAQNRRIYSGWPQEQPRLSGIEPDEGWIIFYEEQAVVLWDTTEEEIYIDFHIWVTRLTLAEDVLDILDDLYHWKIAGQNSRTFGERNVVHSQRIHCLETFDDEVKLYRKVGRYRFKCVKVPFAS